MSVINFGFSGKPTDNKVPPGQFVVKDFPVLTYGPTPTIDLAKWQLEVLGEVGMSQSWSWQEFLALPMTTMTTDIHCVTRWSKLGTHWRGVSLDYIFEQAELKPTAKFLIAECHGGYTTNLPLSDVTGGQAMVALEFDGASLEPIHGGPARLFIPHLYLWKSAKWLQRLRLATADEAGFWERNGYHDHGDPWKEERYSGD